MDIEHIFREESGRILATLIRLLGSFDLAEEAMQEAFTIAVEQWPRDGMPGNPRAWLVSTAHHKAVDLLRRRARFDSRREELQRTAELEQQLVIWMNLCCDQDRFTTAGWTIRLATIACA
jgi:RNA polymerase sigma-70 factor (ECF subfamily)